MFHEVVAALPPWLVVGVLLGLAGSLLVALAFLSAGRLLPDSEREHRQGGESRRRREFREYLETIDEPYAEGHVVEGQPVAFYLPERDVAITFDARAYYRIDRSETDPVLAEHEMPGAVLGERLPFETPDVGLGENGSGDGGGSGSGEGGGSGDWGGVDPARAAFAELGVPAGASVEEIKRAYRRKIKDVHPDQGGDEDAFRRVREAYTIAKEHAD